ncbi:MAG: hypothetical protein R2828_15695 [Saprospiraceae bacterium]
MTDILKTTVNYFKPPYQYFWCWAEGGEVIEWNDDGETICYRDDLALILESIAPKGVPQLGTLLLLLAAFQDKPLDRVKDLLEDLASRIPLEGESIENIKNFIVQTIEFMKVIQRLPKSLRSGNHRIHLLNELVAKVPNRIPPDKAQEVIAMLNAGTWDNLMIKGGTSKNILRTFTIDLENISHLFDYFKNTDQLELVLKTGLHQLPSSISITLPAEAPGDLITALAQDAKTIGLSRLAKRLLAALHIPMHTQGVSDLPFGGISDISNRGNLDRLLLSELAQDDLSLTARLVNNEALYLQREEPPSPLVKERIILLDNTLKMWGIPRVFGIATALACAQNRKDNVVVKAYMLGGELLKPINLVSKAGVVDALEQLDVHLHCGETLYQVLTNQKATPSAEFIFITDEATINHPGFQSKFAEVKGLLSFLILINRAGRLQFFQYLNGHRKLISTSKFDLQELNHSTSLSQVVISKDSGSDALPMALRIDPFPLYFPAFRLDLRRKNTFLIPGKQGVLSITAEQRVLLWKGNYVGARAIISNIEKGNYYFAYSKVNGLYLLVCGIEVFKLYHIDLTAHEVTSLPIKYGHQVRQVFLEANEFLFFSRGSWFKIDKNTGDATSISFSAFKKQNKLNEVNYTYDHNVAEIKKIVNPGYTIISKIKRIYLNANGRLALDGREIRLLENTIHFSEFTKGRQWVDEIKVKETKPMLADNPFIHFGRRKWEYGSEAIIDERGFLHLRSGNRNLPEVTMVLVIGKPLAFWASDGTYCGSYYFIGQGGQKELPAQAFYRKYIQAFIDGIA